MTVAQIATKLDRAEAEIIEAHRCAGIGIADEAVNEPTLRAERI
jgi:hypothetical protein